jgi:hypothetical protein
VSKYVAVLVLSVTVAVGSGGCTRGHSPKEAVSSAWPKARQAGTARLQVAVDADQSSPLTSAQGVIDFTTGRGLFTVDAGPQGAAAAGPGTAVLDGDVLYMKLPPEVADRAGRPWAQFTPRDTLAVPAVAALAGFPAHAADPLLGATAVAKLGVERQGGQAMTHYRAVLNPHPSPFPEEQLRRRLGPQLPADVWVDAAGRLRRLELAVGTDGEVSLAGHRVTFLFDGFGTGPARVDVPGPEQVVKASTLALLTAPSAGLVTVLDPNAEFVVGYPSTWSRHSPAGADGRLRLDSGGSTTLTVGASPIDVSVDAGSLAAGKAIIDAMPNPNPPVATVRELPITLNGLVGYYRLVVPAVKTPTQDFSEADYFLFQDHKLYTLVFHAAPASAFPGLAKTFDDVAQSFHPTQ